MAAKKETAAAAPAVSDKKKALETAMQQIEKMYGKGSIMRYGDGTVANVEAIPTGSLALDLAPSVRVNCVCPADVDTPLLAQQLADANGGYTLADVAAAYPLQRIAAAGEIAHVICSLAAPANSFMTGSVVTVDGGLTAG